MRLPRPTTILVGRDEAAGHAEGDAEAQGARHWTLGGRRPMCSERMVGKWLDMVVMEACREHGIWLKHDHLHLLLNRHLTELGE